MTPPFEPNRSSPTVTPELGREASHFRFFTSSEVAEILKMHPQVITRKLQAGDIGGYKLGKDWRVSEGQLLEFLERHRNQASRPVPGPTP